MQNGNNRFSPMNYWNYPPQYDIVKVNGENGANAFQMGPNSRILLLDENNPIVWLVQTDGAGYKTVTPYDILPHKITPSIDINSLEERIAALEERINAKSHSGTNNKNSKRPAATVAAATDVATTISE